MNEIEFFILSVTKSKWIFELIDLKSIKLDNRFKSTNWWFSINPQKLIEITVK